MTKWIIIDWTSCVMFEGKQFNSFEDGEDFLCATLGDNYETDRGEFEVIPKTSTRKSRYIDVNHPNGDKELNHTGHCFQVNCTCGKSDCCPF